MYAASNLSGLKISLCQMPVIPGRPEVNADYMIREIEQAARRGCDCLVFPEMCIPGYLIGDQYEDDSFVRDVLVHNGRVRDATVCGVTAILGSIDAHIGAKGEDGRMRKFNAGFVAQNGQWAHCTHKFLQPNYRMFDDDRHFFSKRKECGEAVEQERQLDDAGERTPDVTDFFAPFYLATQLGAIRAGVILCEDMWHDDYAYNPSQYLVERGAQIIFNLSASPWSWQKNRKRHQVVRDLLKENPVWFVYANNTGVQNNGKNIVVFDGSSAVYRPDGEVVFEIGPYEKGTRDMVLYDAAPAVPQRLQDDTAELFAALACAGTGMVATIPPHMRKMVVGLSGGIDSSVSAAFWAHIVGPENVYGVSMPFSAFTSSQSMNLAEELAKNLGIHFEVRPIDAIVDAICGATGTQHGTPSYPNVMARARMEILAARAQDVGGIFTPNWNKVEAAFGYGTDDGDMRGGPIAILGDLVKREVYQIGDYLNRVVFGRGVIPRGCFERKPTAEIEENQFDPFDYGSLGRRGYHDEMVRAFTEFRRNPEWFADKYLDGTLEQEFQLEPGTLHALFPTGKSFIADLEKRWTEFHLGYRKRIKVCPIVIVSKRAFGFDLRESLLPPHLTLRYRNILKPNIEGD